ncbi:MAG: hypothetical protein FWE24_11650 [Defluviitaleaceae bacterium]|nr:hypothetical protein [Defluviitaleaceae bacterium]
MMDARGFKRLLFESGSPYLGEFRLIEDFFNIAVEIEEFENIIRLKNEIENDPLYRYHPIRKVRANSLAYFCEVLQGNEAKPAAFEFKEPDFSIGVKSRYSLHELGTFKLCPKLYFHRHTGLGAAYRGKFHLKLYFQAIIFAKCLGELEKGSLDEIFERNIRFFDFLNENEKEEAKSAATVKLKEFADCDFVRVLPRDWRGDGYELVLGYDIHIKKRGKNRLYQRDLGIHYLNFDKAAGKMPVHYADIINLLDKNDENTDRAALVSRIINKINIQFDSGSYKFAEDGIKRTDRLVREIAAFDFSKAKGIVSGYCKYCPVYGICRPMVGANLNYILA